MIENTYTEPYETNRSPDRVGQELKFMKFHADHPEIYQSLVSLAKMTKLAGVEHYGIRDLASILRWRYALAGKKGTLGRNSFFTLYARLIEAQEPELRGFFFTSKSDADRWYVEKFGDPNESNEERDTLGSTILKAMAAQFFGEGEPVTVQSFQL